VDANNIVDNKRIEEKARSKVDTSNIIGSKRTRTQIQQPNVDYFAGKKYHMNMLNIREDAFQKFKNSTRRIFENKSAHVLRNEKESNC